MSGYKELTIGTLMLLGFAIVSGLMAGFGLIIFAVTLSVLGAMAIFLYQLKDKGVVNFFGYPFAQILDHARTQGRSRTAR